MQKPLNASFVKNEKTMLSECSPYVVYVNQIILLQKNTKYHSRARLNYQYSTSTSSTEWEPAWSVHLIKHRVLEEKSMKDCVVWSRNEGGLGRCGLGDSAQLGVIGGALGFQPISSFVSWRKRRMNKLGKVKGWLSRALVCCSFKGVCS